MKYNTSDLAVIIPTKDRPTHVKRHLKSLADQDCNLGRVIVVDSGLNIEEIVLSFKNRLPVEYYRSEPGQVRQRNLAISLLDDSTKLVASMDDDITYHEGAISEMINFWNSVESVTAGVGFNIVYQSNNNSKLLTQILNKSNQAGRVKRSGECMPFVNLNKDTKVQWLSGGATVWKYEILKKYKHNNNLLDLKWAVCEDSIYSYSLGKKFNLMACAGSKVQIEGEIMNDKLVNFHMRRSKVRYAMRLYFVLKNKELSRILFFLNQLFFTIKLLIKLIFFWNIKYLYEFIGTTKGFLINIDVLLTIQPPEKLIQRIISDDND